MTENILNLLVYRDFDSCLTLIEDKNNTLFYVLKQNKKFHDSGDFV